LASTVKSRNYLTDKDSSPDIVDDAVQFLAGLAVVDSLGLGVSQRPRRSAGGLASMPEPHKV